MGYKPRQGDRLLIDKLKGKISVIEKEGARKQKYPAAFCKFVAPDNGNNNILAIQPSPM